MTSSTLWQFHLSMALKSLSDPMAFSAGATLWVVPDPAVSYWARKIDWYLNFLLARAEHRRAPVFELGFLQLLREEDLAPPAAINRPEAPLLLSCAHRLPASQLVRLPYQGDLGQWAKAATKIWRDLRQPALRLFLPTGETYTRIKNLWPENLSSNISVVSDNETKTESHS